MNNKGLTLIELLVVLVIIALIAAIAVINIISTIEKGRQKRTMADMRTIAINLETYNIDLSMYPSNGLTMAQLRNALEPFSARTLPETDGWGNDFQYSTDGRSSYTLESYGRDGLDGDNISYNTRFEFDRDIVIYNGTFTARPVE